MAYEQILVDAADGITTITLNRPDRLNAWTPLMANEMRDAVQAAGNDPDQRVIVVTGAGRGFCAGADMNALQSIQEGGGGRTAPREVSFADAPGPDLDGALRRRGRAVTGDELGARRVGLGGGAGCGVGGDRRIVHE